MRSHTVLVAALACLAVPVAAQAHRHHFADRHHVDVRFIVVKRGS